jgi:hypothetical protein
MTNKLHSLAAAIALAFALPSASAQQGQSPVGGGKQGTEAFKDGVGGKKDAAAFKDGDKGGGKKGILIGNQAGTTGFKDGDKGGGKGPDKMGTAAFKDGDKGGGKGPKSEALAVKGGGLDKSGSLAFKDKEGGKGPSKMGATAFKDGDKGGKGPKGMAGEMKQVDAMKGMKQ